ncbi:MAG TPA: hypothetical protein VKD90_05225 [Gemmataceae bacterium]|nr:hypothetical protein [Gemmataceae bacterium]
MSNPVPVSVVPDERPMEVVIIAHSPLFYWWPVWAVGFLMAGLSYWQDQRMAFVPPGTVAERGARVEGIEGPRDVLIAPAGRPLPGASDSEELQQPRMRMAESNNPGVIWAITLCLVVAVTHVKLRGVWSLVAVLFILFSTVLLAVLRLWDPIFRWIGFLDIHLNAFGFFSISLFLFVMWLLMFVVFDRLTYMIFTRGRLRVRKFIGEGELVFDMRGMTFQRHRDDMFRHWMLGFGTADLTVFTSGANSQQLEMPNVMNIGRKLSLINTMLQELEVTKAR